MISKSTLVKLYIDERQSMQQIADKLACSVNQVDYWMNKHNISKRTISEGVYVKCNPHGDPFSIYRPRTVDEAMLHGIGLGLYWGEGTKANKHSIRLGNTDPKLILTFVSFLRQAYGVKKENLKFGLQIFSDMSPDDAMHFWQKYLGVSSNNL